MNQRNAASAKSKATQAGSASQAGGPSYRPVYRDVHPGEWAVASGPPDAPSPVMLSGFKTEKAAQEAADTLNRLDLNERQRDEVLSRMLSTPRKRDNQS